MTRVLGFTGTTTNDVPVGNVVQAAADANLTGVLVLGWTSEGEFYAAASDGSSAENCHLAQHFIHRIHSGDWS